MEYERLRDICRRLAQCGARDHSNAFRSRPYNRRNRGLMDARAEERILRLALRQGLVTHEDLAALPPASDREAPSARFGPRVDLLIARGRLDAAPGEPLLPDATVEGPPPGGWGAVPAPSRAPGAQAPA